MSRLYRLTLVVMLLFPICQKTFADGNQLLEQCISAEQFLDTQAIGNELNIGICIGFVRGVSKTMEYIASDNPIKSCLPEKGIPLQQGVRIIVKFLKSNPALLHLEEEVIVMLAFKDAYPCH